MQLKCVLLRSHHNRVKSEAAPGFCVMLQDTARWKDQNLTNFADVSAIRSSFIDRYNMVFSSFFI